MATAATIKKRVAKGAVFLDGKVPGWAAKIKPAKIEMDSNEMCILGQLAKKARVGDAFDYCDALKIEEGVAESLGFQADYDNLEVQTEAWRTEIEKRTTTPAPTKKASTRKASSAKK